MMIIRETKNGKVFTCKAIHVEYKNVSFNLSNIQFQDFSKYLNKLDGLE